MGGDYEEVSASGTSERRGESEGGEGGGDERELTLLLLWWLCDPRTWIKLSEEGKAAAMTIAPSLPKELQEILVEAVTTA